MIFTNGETGGEYHLSEVDKSADQPKLKLITVLLYDMYILASAFGRWCVIDESPFKFRHVSVGKGQKLYIAYSLQQ